MAGADGERAEQEGGAGARKQSGFHGFLGWPAAENEWGKSALMVSGGIRLKTLQLLLYRKILADVAWTCAGSARVLFGSRTVRTAQDDTGEKNRGQAPNAVQLSAD
jgi:hypothetical protein